MLGIRLLGWADCLPVRRRAPFLLAASFLLAPIVSRAGALSLGFLGEEVVKVTPAWSATAVRTGGTIILALEADIRAPYHINSDHPKPNFIPTKIELLDAPPGLLASTPVFPEPRMFEFGSAGAKETIPVFTGRTVFYVSMAAGGSISPGDFPLQIKLTYQACNETQCLPETSVTATTSLKVVASDAVIQPTNAKLFADFEGLKDRVQLNFFGRDFVIRPSNLLLLLSFAVLGGFLLNLTPCVLPMIPIKIMGFSKAASNPGQSLLLGAVMSAGVVAFWLGLAAAIAGISGFSSTNKLFQYPAFTVGVGLVIWAMAIGMCGFFSVQLPQWVYRFQPSQESLTGSFLFGIMTAVLSTPCTAPFMGGAAAWAATQRSAVTFATFGAIGTGMALPYLVLSAFPKLTSKMPRSGAAGDLIKQVMGLLMFAAGAYFLGTGLAGWFVHPPDPPSQAYWWLVAAFVVAAGGGLAWRTMQIAKSKLKQVLFGTLGVALVVAGVAMGIGLTRGSPIHWTYYSPQRLTEAQAQAKIVVMEFTAAWCLNCHLLERAVLHDPRVVAALNTEGIAPFKVDLTGNNEAGNQKLVEVGRRTIPFLVIYDGKGGEVFRSDAYTVEQILEAIAKAKAATG